MEGENLKMLQEVINAIGGTGSAVISEYTVWFIVSAIGWIILGVAIIYSAYKWKVENEGPCDDFYWGRVLARSFFMFIGALFIFCNVPDLFSPEAAAIHRLLQDVKIGS